MKFFLRPILLLFSFLALTPALSAGITLRVESDTGTVQSLIPDPARQQSAGRLRANTFSVSGHVRRNSGAAVPGTTINMSGTTSGSDLTNATGNYLFPNLAAGSNLTLVPVKNTDFKECVSVRDLLFIWKHILGLQPLGSPYQMIEADANRSGSITLIDVLTIQNLILGRSAQYPNSDSWRFVPADFGFANPSNPFSTPFPEAGDITNLQADAVQDFIGMKIGDATDCVDDAHGPAFLTLTAPNLTANVGDNINVNIASQGLPNASGLQFSLSWDPAVLQFNGMAAPLPGWSASNYHVSGGQLSVCWYNSTSQVLSDALAVFTLQFTVIGSAGSSSPIAFVEHPTRSEVVDGLCNPFDLNRIDGSVLIHCPLACNDQITVVLDDNCAAAIGHLEILDGSICPGTYTLDVRDVNNVPLLSGVNPAILNGSMDDPLHITVTHHPSGDQCFAQVVLAGDCLAADSCCRDQAAFLATAMQGFTVVQQQCGLSVIPNALDDCQQTTYTWGDGSTTEPLAGGVTTGHIYAVPGFYEVCASIREINTLGLPCFAFDTCWQVCVTCDTCSSPVLKDEWSKFPAITKNFSGNNSPYDMYADAIGDFYVTANRTTSLGDENGFVSKYRSDGTLEWDFSFGGSNDEQGALINRNPLDEGFYLGGALTSAGFDMPSPGGMLPSVPLDNNGSHPQPDVFLARYDADLNLVWAFNWGGTFNDQINGMAVDNSGNVYVTGLAFGNVDFNPLGPPVVIPDLTAAYVSKYHPNGQLEWVRLLSGTLNLGLALDEAGNVYVGGHFQGTPDLQGWPVPGAGFPVVGLHSVFTVPTEVAPYVAKFDNNGSLVWAFAIQDAARTSTGAVWDVEVEGDYLYAAGVIKANTATNFDPRASNLSLTFTNPNFVARYDLQGYLQIPRELPPFHNVYEIEIGPTGKVYTAGHYGGGVLLTDIFDADLHLIKSLQTGTGTIYDGAWTVAPDPFDNFGLAGRIGSQPFDADPQFADGFEETFTDGQQHVFIGKYTCDCPGDAVPICTPCDSISVTLAQQPGDQSCCATIAVHNQLPDCFSAVQISTISGGSLFLSNVTPQTGWQVGGFVNGSSVLLEPTGGGSIPMGTHNVAFFCTDGLTNSEQIIEIQYFDQNNRVLCRDTLYFDCDYCAKIVQSTAICEGIGQRKITFCVQIPANQSWSANSIVLQPPAGFTFTPTAFSLPNTAPGSTACTFTTIVSNSTTAWPQTLCFDVTAHQMDVNAGQPPGECCTIETCIDLPDCLCDGTSATAELDTLNSDACCWNITLHQPDDVFAQVNTHLITPGVLFSSVENPFNSGWDMSLHSVSNISWTPELPQGSTVQDGYILPKMCFADDGSAMATSPVQLVVTWYTADLVPCYDTLLLPCPSLPHANDCARVDSIDFTCGSALVPNVIKIRVFNHTHSPAVDVDKVQLYAIGPPGINIGPAIFNTFIPNGGFADFDVAVINVNPGEQACFYVSLYDLNAAGAELHCCTSDAFCFTMPDCGPVNQQPTVLIYPNPTTGNVSIRYTQSSPIGGRLRVREVMGRLLREEIIVPGANEQQVSLAAYPTGVYFIEIIDNEGLASAYKLVKQ